MTGPFQTLAEHFNGTSWTVVPTPALSGALGWDLLRPSATKVR